MAAITDQDSSDNGIFGGILGRFTDEFYLLFRLIFAFLVALHGSQKAFLLWGFPAGANPNGLGTLLDIAGWVELIAAFLIAFGVLTRLGAGALVVTMIVAYFGVHAALSPVWPWPHLYPMEGGFAAHGGEGNHLVVHLCRHHWHSGQPQVGPGTDAVRQGDFVSRRLPIIPQPGRVEGLCVVLSKHFLVTVQS